MRVDVVALAEIEALSPDISGLAQSAGVRKAFAPTLTA
jgi:hypothetical protein